MSKIAVLASGGVDSSVALRLLAAEQRHRLVAFYLKIWLEDEMAFLGSCPWQEDLEVVREVCEQARVELRIVSLQREYFATVVASTISQLEAGRTPSPDVLCNRFIKFGAFAETIGSDFEAVASGHYARTSERGGNSHLLRARDPVKDQSYFLCQMSQAQVARARFPIGHLLKSEVRELANDLGLSNAQRPDSQGICFLGRIPYDDFIHFHLGDRRGEIVDHHSGEVLGEHRGYWYHTIGQRRGLGLAGGPWYVVDKDQERNRVVVAHADRREGSTRSQLVVPLPNWIAGPPTHEELEVKLRHGPKLVPARVRLRADGAAEVELTEPDAGVAAGQFTVFYDGQECLGGGEIG